jgi:hypothetical protein
MKTITMIGKSGLRLDLGRSAAWNLAWAATLVAAALPLPAGAQSHASASVVLTQVATGEPADNGGLAPAEIITRVRAAGFDPRSRPIQRGAVYFLFAVDHQYMDVRLTVDANSGRVISATRLAGMRYGGPGYDGHEVLSRTYERPPTPPADIPNRGAARNSGPANSAQPHPPLPRARPGDAVTGSAQPEAVPGGLGDTTAEIPSAAAPPPSATSQAALPTSPPQQPTMVPIAPLE